jgi:hypothetical protein
MELEETVQLVDWPEGRRKALRPSTLNYVETYRNLRSSVALAKITWMLVVVA